MIHIICNIIFKEEVLMKLAKRIISAVIAIAFVMTLAFADFTAIDAEAGKTKTVKSSVPVNFFKPTYKKAPKIKKGTTTLVSNRDDGALFCFTATKTKTYTFTFSNLTEKGKDSKTYGSVGYVSVFLIDSRDSLSYAKVSTQGGKNDTLWLSNKYGEKYHTKDKLVNRCIAKRSGKIKLKKGQQIYFLASPGLKGKGTVTVNIK